MANGAALTQVLPKEEEETELDIIDDLEPLGTTSLLDPTAIATEYRFVIALPKTKRPDDDRQRNFGGTVIEGINLDAATGVVE